MGGGEGGVVWGGRWLRGTVVWSREMGGGGGGEPRHFEGGVVVP